MCRKRRRHEYVVQFSAKGASRLESRPERFGAPMLLLQWTSCCGVPRKKHC